MGLLFQNNVQGPMSKVQSRSARRRILNTDY